MLNNILCKCRDKSCGQSYRSYSVLNVLGFYLKMYIVLNFSIIL